LVFLVLLEVSSTVSPPLYQATIFGPYSHLLSIRASGWSTRFEECMIASAEAQGLEEDLASIEASVGDLVGAEEAEVMAGKT
jgi:hypothetical protein